MGEDRVDPRTRPVDDDERERFRAVLAESVGIAESEDIAYVVAGSLASNHWGRPSAIGDIDMVVAPQDAKHLLKALDAAGFETAEDDPQWIFKARKNDVTVDIIFEIQGALYLDDDMVAHGILAEIEGTKLRLMSAEDFVVSQAVSVGEDTPNYWYNALSVLATRDLDWDYLIRRASRGARRVLSLLVWAQSDDRPVPDSVIQLLFDEIYGR